MNWEQYDELVPFMDDESRVQLARCVLSDTEPSFSPLLLSLWTAQAAAKKEYWKKCKTNVVKK